MAQATFFGVLKQSIQQRSPPKRLRLAVEEPCLANPQKTIAIVNSLY
jgi:hypothetical protein